MVHKRIQSAAKTTHNVTTCARYDNKVTKAAMIIHLDCNKGFLPESAC